MTIYTHSITGDITAQALDVDALHAELADDALGGKFDGVSNDGSDAFYVYTTSALTAGEITTKDATILAPTETPQRTSHSWPYQLRA